MLEKVRTYINKHIRLTGNKPVIIGLSGGADSVALLSILIKLGYTCIAAHCNFHLRGDESNRDEQFSESLASQMKIPFSKIDFDTKGYAAQKNISIEMAARELRYDWFEEIRRQYDAQAIAVAHHRDDNVETVLMNLIRGTGIRGVRGIRPQNGFIIRPLLDVSRQDITTWLDTNQLTYITDSTNLSDDYTRNFIRLNILPLMEKINPSARQAIARSLEHLASVETIYLSVIEKAKATAWKEENRLSISALLEFPSPETILFELLSPFHFTRTVSEEIFQALDKTPGKIFYSPTHRLIKDRNDLIVLPLEKKENCFCLLEKEEGSFKEPIELSWHKAVVTSEYYEELVNSSRLRSRITAKTDRAYFDYDKLTFPLTLRKWRAGDWFVPFGMKGKKKVSDYFSDHKYSLEDKEKTWLLCSGEDIIWIVGERTDNRYKIRKSTSYALIVNFSGKKEQDI